MPKINLRLTEEELAELKRWAEDSRRSIQREAVFRIFEERSKGNISVDAQPRDIPTRTVAPDSHFRPDPKPSWTKKRT